MLLNIGTIVLAFAAADRWLALTWPDVFTFRANDQSLRNADQFLYLSWTTITTLGNNYSAVSTWSQVLVVSEVVSGLLMLTVIVGCLMALVTPKLRG